MGILRNEGFSFAPEKSRVPESSSGRQTGRNEIPSDPMTASRHYNFVKKNFSDSFIIVSAIPAIRFHPAR
jgi:hypothetical protein